MTRSGTNEFEFGTEVAWEPSSLQSSKDNHFDREGGNHIIGSYDEYDRSTASVYASGPIVQDKLFFFAMYEARDYQPVNTDDEANSFFDAQEDNGFWGAKIDWQINDRHLVELLGILRRERGSARRLRLLVPAGRASAPIVNTRFTNSGGLNWSSDVYRLSHRHVLR